MTIRGYTRTTILTMVIIVLVAVFLGLLIVATVQAQRGRDRVFDALTREVERSDSFRDEAVARIGELTDETIALREKLEQTEALIRTLDEQLRKHGVEPAARPSASSSTATSPAPSRARPPPVAEPGREAPPSDPPMTSQGEEEGTPPAPPTTIECKNPGRQDCEREKDDKTEKPEKPDKEHP